MSGTTLHAAITALVSTFTTAASAIKLQVVDGPDYDPRTAFLAVGWHSNEEPAAVVTREIADVGMRADHESHDIACLLSYHIGNDTVAATRLKAFTTYELLAAALNADRKLGGAVHRARIGELAYLPQRDEGGALVSVRFNVNVIAWK